jgi:DNA-binding CsgD family transcriptional regulator
LVARLGTLVGAPLALFVVDPCFDAGGKGPLADRTAWGFGGERYQFIEAILELGRTINPVLSKLIARSTPQRPGEVTSLMRSDVVANDAWHETPYFVDHVRPAACDDFICSTRETGVRGLVSGLCLIRGLREAPFSEEDRDLVHLFHLEAGSLLRAPEAVVEAKRRHALPPRARQTLDELLTGASRKDIASRLGISTHTVHQYTKMVFRAFGVASRGELLARANGRRPKSL